MKFTKMHGCGNDYVYVDCTKEVIPNISETAIRVSDRHFGIGSDGLILIKASDVADFEMDMYNADGSRGKMCGNGIRCVAKYVYDHGLTDKMTITVNTLSGIKTLKLTVEDGKVSKVRVDMGEPELIPAQVPVKASVLGLADDRREAIVAEPLEIKGRSYDLPAYLWEIRTASPLSGRMSEIFRWRKWGRSLKNMNFSRSGSTPNLSM